MAFIAILLALALERFFDWSHFRRWQWFEAYCQRLAAYIDSLSPALRLAFWLAPLALLAGLIERLLSGWLLGLPCLLFDFVVLVYCFGPLNFWAQVYGCLQAMHQGDTPLVETRVKAAFPQVLAVNSQALHQALVRTIFIEGQRRVFGVLFWFCILGPLGAVLYRLTALAKSKALADLAVLSTKTLEVLDWLPARLLGFLFALGGHFVKVLAIWQKYALQGLETSEAIITETGLTALDLPLNKPLPENGEVEKQALQLFDRALIIMLVVSAVVVLIFP